MLDLLRKRRSVRRFLERPIEAEKVELLIEALLRSPSSKGRNPWEFIIVTDPEQRAKLAAAKPRGGSFVANAPLAIVVCADPDKCDVWVEDCSIAAIILQLAALELGLGSCWSQIRKRNHIDGDPSSDYLCQQLNLPDRYEVEAIIGIGYPLEEKAGHDKNSLAYNKIHRNVFGS
ncbi:NAD(P)H-dependent dehydrogenase/reductase [Syntrophotalea acetylenivorans]|uniref:NAD(P)H-dependent dehydrogenase/reductase n=1 Tax=Syntrophotalea acetylenivorans TaxID=1842532 RepID=A0A1L3GLT2_9BACT|nr:nitroreductase family protein [Syntrophotalea acetylenivorans]APG26884.1 NAD(P)H-dependent dehydrogenase/reductase [Syntrophotalea acetylenivorans]